MELQLTSAPLTKDEPRTSPPLRGSFIRYSQPGPPIFNQLIRHKTAVEMLHINVAGECDAVQQRLVRGERKNEHFLKLEILASG
jgi:hypothetical protein